MTTIVVLGMHRSGTSCVTRALHEGGMYLGENLMNQTATDNLEGHWEAYEAVQLNDDILAASGAIWHTIPSNFQLVAPAGIEARIASFLSKLAVRPMSGFKDPRTLITYPLWKPHLGTTKIVACLRHPYSVARSLAQRVSEWKLEMGLEMWVAYNSRLLQYASEANPDDVFWFDFDAPPDLAEQTLQYVVRSLGLTPQGNRFNELLRHHEQQPAIQEPRLAELYEALRERVRAQEPRARAQCDAISRESGQLTGENESRRLLDQMRVVSVRHDELIQRQQASLWALEAHWQEVHSRADGLVARWQEVQSRHERLETQYTDLAERQHGSDAAHERLAQQCAEALQRAEALESRLGEAYIRFAEQRMAEARLTENMQSLTEALRQHEQQQTRHAALVSQFQERIRILEQRLFWPMVVRKSRSAVRRLKASLTPRKLANRQA